MATVSSSGTVNGSKNERKHHAHLDHVLDNNRSLSCAMLVLMNVLIREAMKAAREHGQLAQLSFEDKEQKLFSRLHLRMHSASLCFQPGSFPPEPRHSEGWEHAMWPWMWAEGEAAGCRRPSRNVRLILPRCLDFILYALFLLPNFS